MRSPEPGARRPLRSRMVALVGAAVLLHSDAALAQIAAATDYPKQTVRLIVGLAWQLVASTRAQPVPTTASP